MTKMTDDQVVAELLRLDELRCEHMNTGDVAACGALLTEDLIHIHAIGLVETKPEFLAKNVAIEKRPVRSRGPLKVRLYGDYAIMTGPQFIETSERRAELMVTQVWRLDAGAWRQASFHACRTAAP